ncbi:hypothetical protein [Curtobacterium sp. 20TX0008]|uniref:hypothetical protein n=1 Tax=Curtobacterium sp. 20TX0008 TaxID=3022018 RepID=UPI00232BD40B|nr:hypothetical protein [Curtobacterium sp. 20TX0008]MDB6427950.1 hypothetical protein [Curtobacterium sp. 20TX0008]
MRSRVLRLAYAIPPVLAFVLAFVGLAVTDESGVVGSTSSVTVSLDGAAQSNRVIAGAIARVAREHHATVVRMVADRADPIGRRTALVTDAPGTIGEQWLRDGYPDFSRTMSSRVRPMSDLDRVDPAGTYELFGDEAARRDLVRAFASAGYGARTESTPLLGRLGIGATVDGVPGLVGVLVLGATTACLVATVGSPRRCAVRRLHGHSTARILRQELGALRTSATVALVGAPLAGVGIWIMNGAAQWPALVAATAVLGAALLTPVVLAHATGVLLACRRPLVDALRGARPPGGVVGLAHAARLVATLLLVSAVSGLVGAEVVARTSGTERDLRAAGTAVQLWITPDPRPIESQAYWDRLGRFAGGALQDHDALLSAVKEVSTGSGNAGVPALFVDAEYLRLQDVRAADGTRIRAGSRPTVWIPEHSWLDPDALVRSLTDWDLRDAPDAARRDITVGRLGTPELWTYPDGGSVRGWLDDAVLVVVPTPATMFSADQLGSWLSTGDVAFRDRARAERAIHAAGVGSEISAVVDVGQAAAETARGARRTVVAQAAAVVSAAVVAVVLAALATSAHRRRHGRARFAKTVAGVHPVRADGDLLTVEVVSVVLAALAAGVAWSRLRLGDAGQISVLDPLTQAASPSALLAVTAAVVVSILSTSIVLGTARETDRSRGDEAR